MTLLEITEMGAKAGRIVYGCAKNIYDIVKEKEAAAPSESERIVWADLMTRSQWCYRFVERSYYPLAQKAITALGGIVQPELQAIRIARPVTFTAVPCKLCQSLEKSFAPSDSELRIATTPFWGQYYKLFEALVADAYALRGAGQYFYDLIADLRPTLTDPIYDLPLKYWDFGVKGGEDFLAYGRNCFGRTEIARTLEKDDWRQQSRVDSLETNVNHKYFSTQSTILSAQGGLFALNTELLCTNCKPTVEDKPLVWGTNV